MQARLVLHHLGPPLAAGQSHVAELHPASAITATVIDVALAPSSPVLSDLARKSGLPDLRTI